MPVWNNSEMTTLYYSSEQSSVSSCVVKLEEDEVLVEYYEDGEFYQYKGKSNGEGHFELQAKGFNGRATLHMFKDSRVLEGSWTEEGSKGMWRIELHQGQD